MRPLWHALLRFAVLWGVLVLIGGTLGVGTAEAMRAGWVSEQTVAIALVVLSTGVLAVMFWAARGLDFDLWDDPYEWDDDSPTDDVPTDGTNTLPDP